MTLPDSPLLPSKVRHALTAALMGLLLVGVSLSMSPSGPTSAVEPGVSNEAMSHLLFAPVTPEKPSEWRFQDSEWQVCIEETAIRH